MVRLSTTLFIPTSKWVEKSIRTCPWTSHSMMWVPKGTQPRARLGVSSDPVDKECGFVEEPDSLLPGEKASHPDPHLDSVDAGIRHRQTRVGDMHVAGFETPIV